MRKRKIIHNYKLHSSLQDYECFYCNQHAESKDHIPPISYCNDFEVDERVMVRSCLLCNSLLGARHLHTLLLRSDYLLVAYRRRFYKLLSMPLWTEEEISELTGSLKRKILLAIKKKIHIEKKILFIENNIRILQGY